MRLKIYLRIQHQIQNEPLLPNSLALTAKDPLALAALGYDAMNFLAEGIRHARGTEPAALQKALSETRDFPGVTGTITLDADRKPSKSAIVLRVDAGKFNYLETVAP